MALQFLVSNRNTQKRTSDTKLNKNPVVQNRIEKSTPERERERERERGVLGLDNVTTCTILRGLMPQWPTTSGKQCHRYSPNYPHPHPNPTRTLVPTFGRVSQQIFDRRGHNSVSTRLSTTVNRTSKDHGRVHSAAPARPSINASTSTLFTGSVRRFDRQ